MENYGLCDDGILVCKLDTQFQECTRPELGPSMFYVFILVKPCFGGPWFFLKGPPYRGWNFRGDTRFVFTFSK